MGIAEINCLCIITLHHNNHQHWKKVCSTSSWHETELCSHSFQHFGTLHDHLSALSGVILLRRRSWFLLALELNRHFCSCILTYPVAVMSAWFCVASFITHVGYNESVLAVGVTLHNEVQLHLLRNFFFVKDTCANCQTSEEVSSEYRVEVAAKKKIPNLAGVTKTALFDAPFWRVEIQVDVWLRCRKRRKECILDLWVASMTSYTGCT